MGMLRVDVDLSVLDAFPETEVRLLLALGMRNQEPWELVEGALADLERRVLGGEFRPLTDEDPEVASWHDAYRTFGTNPRRFRPSLDALSRRLHKRGALPRINPAVDAYNLISVMHKVPAGAFDAARLTGPVTIRASRPDDRFIPLGEPEVMETPHPGEIVYAMGREVLTRHWNYRDADATKVTQDTREALFCLDRAFVRAAPSASMAEAQEALAVLLAPRVQDLRKGTLSVAHREVLFSW